MKDKQCFTSVRHANTLGPSTIKNAMTKTKIKHKIQKCESMLEYTTYSGLKYTKHIGRVYNSIRV
jgi:hypothetical protein